MAVISDIPGERQPNDSEHLDESNAKGFSCRFKGLYSELQTYDELPKNIESIDSYTDTADEGADYLCSIIYDVKD